MPPADDKNDTRKPAGRVRHDSGGRAIWEWAAESGRHALDSTSRLLKRLDLPGLSLADDEKKQQADAAPDVDEAPGKPKVPTFGGAREADPAGHGRRSFNPYDTRGTSSRPIKKVAAQANPKLAVPVKKTSKRGFFARLFGAR